jgi:CDP-diacylglycerol--glycerol-3-phosphate 3-phosphatidyltransferase
MISLYQMKPAFQSLLRPGVRFLATAGVTANQVTLLALLASLAIGVYLLAAPARHFCILPIWMFLRMGLNAVDGMLAREYHQKSPLGAYLNELSDVLADAALILPFIHVPPFSWPWVGAVIFLSALSEMAGSLGPMVGAPRQYQGPLGKSDRALLFGLLALVLCLRGQLPAWCFWIMPLSVAALLLNTLARIRGGLAQAKRAENGP